MTLTPQFVDYAPVLSRFACCVPAGQINGLPAWKAKCPAHDDRVASLSLWVGSKGNLLVGCHAGCDKRDVLRAVGLTMADLFPDAGKLRAMTTQARRRIVARYDYTAADGTLLYQAVRFDPKDFRQRRPDGAGGWVWNLTDTPRVLYRLGDILDSPRERFVWVVEGEKDADALRTVGLLATTRAMGAKSPWEPQYSRTLAGRPIVVVPDNDAAGRAGAAMVLGELVASGLPASVRLLSLPGLPEHGDASDWLALNAGTRGWQRQTLVAMAKAAPRYGRG